MTSDAIVELFSDIRASTWANGMTVRKRDPRRNRKRVRDKAKNRAYVAKWREANREAHNLRERLRYGLKRKRAGKQWTPRKSVGEVST